MTTILLMALLILLFIIYGTLFHQTKIVLTGLGKNMKRFKGHFSFLTLKLTEFGIQKAVSLSRADGRSQSNQTSQRHIHSQVVIYTLVVVIYTPMSLIVFSKVSEILIYLMTYTKVTLKTLHYFQEKGFNETQCFMSNNSSYAVQVNLRYVY